MEIICQDALKYLKSARKNSLPNIVTGIPDMDEVSMNPAKYLQFFKQSVDLIFDKVNPDSYVIFMVTDRKHQKRWIDKSFLIQQSAYEHQTPLRWHKIILLRPPDSTHIQRPTYQHYLCFSKNMGPGEATPDVMFCGKKTYKNASCPEGTKHAILFLKRYAKTQHVLDPFVGRGTVLKIAQEHNFTGTGIDMDPKQCAAARSLLGIHKKSSSTKSSANKFPGTTKPKKKSSRKTSKKQSRKRSRKKSKR